MVLWVGCKGGKRMILDAGFWMEERDKRKGIRIILGFGFWMLDLRRS